MESGRWSAWTDDAAHTRARPFLDHPPGDRRPRPAPETPSPLTRFTRVFGFYDIVRLELVSRGTWGLL
jgi:hypothetical protein